LRLRERREQSDERSQVLERGWQSPIEIIKPDVPGKGKKSYEEKGKANKET